MAKYKEIFMVIDTSFYSRIHFALGIASSYSALGYHVRIMFGYEGIKRLRKGFIDHIEEGAEIGFQKLTKISEILDGIRKLGGKIYACPTAMALQNLTRDELIEEIDNVMGIVEFTMQAEDKIIYI